MHKKVKNKFTHLGKNKKFNEIFGKLSNDIKLNFDEKTYILATSILFYKQFEKNNKFLSYADISYYIVLKYSLKYNDFEPLFDFAINFGFYPIAKSILKDNLLSKDTFVNEILNIRLNDYFKKNYIETLEQNVKSSNFLKDNSNEKSYLAPTSFGKSSLIIDYIKKMENKANKIAIIVPTKSLLMQTYRMIKDASLHRKILIHDEMYNNENNFVAVFTQERALRLLKRKNVIYDILIIDEAHNLLKKDRNSTRNILLARLIAKNKYLNPNQKVVYLSPLITDTNKLRINKNQKITSHNIKFNIKEPEFYEYTKNKIIYKYNRFTNQFYEIDKTNSYFDYFFKYSKSKNFVYLTSPKKIESEAQKIANNLPIIHQNKELKKIIQILTKEVHKDFFAIDYLKKGIIYLHGRIPNLIKEYFEEKFSTISEIKYIVANSVILEGMNLPIDNLFILSTWGLEGKDLINLIGRVNRLNTIFTEENFNKEKLLPQIHIISTKDYTTGHNPIFKKYLRSRIFKDIVKNPLLSEFDKSKINDKKELEKIDTIIKNEKLLYTKPKNEYEEIEHAFIEADIQYFYEDFDDLIKKFILRKNKIFKLNEEKSDWDKRSVLNKMRYLFINDLIIKDFELSRLKNDEAIKYYEKFIYIGRKKSFNERVNNQLAYFNRKAESELLEDTLIYIGETYGDTIKETDYYPEKHKEVYINIKQKKIKERTNLAIVKLKMEDDFISYKLNKFIVLMYEYKLISKEEYNIFVYGTNDEKSIELTKYGLNINLVNRLLKDNQLKNIEFDIYNNLKVNNDFKRYLSSLNDFQKFELNRYI